MSSQTFILPDGRQLGYAVEGTGKPVIYFHGTASSRLEILLLREFAYTNQLQLIGVDRPGYGLSTYKQRLRLSNFNLDLNMLLDYLKLDKFAVLSWSGGGPFALTYVALNPQRVTHAVAVSCPSLPFDPSVAHNNNPLAKVAMKNRYLAKWALGIFRNSVITASRNIEGFLASPRGKRMLADWAEPDVKFFADSAWLKLMYAAMAEGFRQDTKGIEAIFEEHRLFLKSWEEPIEGIPAGKVTFWQGTQDKTCPSSNVHLLAYTVKGAYVKLFRDDGHCVLFSHLQELAVALKS